MISHGITSVTAAIQNLYLMYFGLAWIQHIGIGILTLSLHYFQSANSSVRRPVIYLHTYIQDKPLSTFLLVDTQKISLTITVMECKIVEKKWADKKEGGLFSFRFHIHTWDSVPDFTLPYRLTIYLYD